MGHLFDSSSVFMGAAKLQYQYFRNLELKKGLVAYLKKNDEEGNSKILLDQGDERGGRTRHEGDKEEPPQQNYEEISDQLATQTSNAPAPHERIVMFMVFLWVGVISLISFSEFADSTNEWVVGIVVNLNVVFFYGAPLSTILHVLKTKNSASIHIWTMITNTANATFWGAYGLAILDPFVYVPNGLGTALGVIQIFLVMTFPRKEEEISLDGSSKKNGGLSATEELSGAELVKSLDEP
jgi:uncharacterized protein with PQ loop repeat